MPAKAFRDGDTQINDGQSSYQQNHNVFRGVWELARLHTYESLITVFPALWGACVAAGTRDITLDVPSLALVLFGILASGVASHAAFTTLNDICDRNFDKYVERCKTRPLPSGLISTKEAIIAFIAWLPTTFSITYFTLGQAAVVGCIPIWTLSALYPLTKRLFNFPQVVLATAVGAGVFPGWASVTQNPRDLNAGLPLFFATACWVVYFDVFYATQDTADDEKIGVKSLAVLMGKHVWLLLSALGLLQVGFFALAGLRAELSPIFWTLGLGVWTLSIPWHIKSLDITDRKSGGRIFVANIKLGVYLTAVLLLELLSTRVSF